MEALVWTLLLLFLVLVSAGVYVSVRAVKAAKRGIDRTVGQARRTVEDTRLRAMRLARPGPAGELAELRLSLRASLRATDEALRAGAPQDASLSEALALFDRLSAHGRELDEELKRLEQEPTKPRLESRLPELRERAERITRSADSLRWAAHDRAQRFARDDLDELDREIAFEASALRHWAPGPEPAAASGASGVPGASSASEGAAGSGGAAHPGPEAGPAAADGPPRSITGPAPTVGTDRWWQKGTSAADAPETAAADTPGARRENTT
ncbi:hypothetical protein [Streptomyces sparsogenes]|uniref:Secreted protein n=1 Tax=Streptomyces sparsogenes DSM 40356 TaxID=1331668 RepID=A0A1R1SJA1_9ACTN|nr:hypothetical protein [Streptomyces sparsogenes]OMI38346.1 secreted protein [Streptomyces sparsogenes DSM 40356]